MDHSAGTFQLTTEVAPGTRYAAVSYRWGSGKDHYMLKLETVEGMRKGVSMGVLPETILDTLTIAHHLGLKYIWIDRLCIFQDSREDWSQEASRMAFIYKHAVVTISASCAIQESQGCFRRRNPAGIQPLRLISNPLLSSQPAAGFHESSYITSNEPEMEQKEGGKLGHLADRGWVFQERILSQRIVHFAEEEVYWECRELEASEAWPEHTEAYLTPKRPSVLYGPGRESWDKHSLWHTIVEDYSTRIFTYDTDKLPALSGLARETAKLRKDDKDEYLSGLWRSTVLLDLCWSDYYDTPRIPEEYLAPSWSWASLHAKISYTAGGSGFGYRPAAQFIDASLKFATGDSYGAVHDGWIHLLGHLKPVTVVRRRNSAEHLQRQEPWPVIIRGENGEPLPFVDNSVGKLDIESFAVEGKRSVATFCLPVVKDREDDPAAENGRPEFYCLLLVPNGSIKHKRSGEALKSPRTNTPDEYQRAGLARLTVNNWSDFKAWLEESAERDVVIR
ncbi:hypothetical protein N8I77_002866 [Diaporthe amygdali]|uniref:Heterokaryon incompatibility domain-containing protein n=1 Tax=Phomopsis amygdali TaxID=1214568 RepID=A0AAD9WC77_PHOAM|nr:hypothetical protein N8I77_002866 [Diaporthe amygdali]